MMTLTGDRFMDTQGSVCSETQYISLCSRWEQVWESKNRFMGGLVALWVAMLPYSKQAPGPIPGLGPFCVLVLFFRVLLFQPPVNWMSTGIGSITPVALIRIKWQLSDNGWMDRTGLNGWLGLQLPVSDVLDKERGPTFQLQGLKESAVNILLSDTTAHQPVVLWCLSLWDCMTA